MRGHVTGTVRSQIKKSRKPFSTGAMAALRDRASVLAQAGLTPNLWLNDRGGIALIRGIYWLTGGT